MWICPQCYSTWKSSTKVCPNCGYINEHPKKYSIDNRILRLEIGIYICGGMLALMSAANYTFQFVFWGFLLHLITYKIHQCSHHPNITHNILIAGRTIGVTLHVLAYLSFAVFLMPNTSKWCYPFKRLVFCEGVHSSAAEVLPLMPPKECEDYYFQIKGQFIAQDYRPYCEFYCHTDENTIKKYEAKLTAQGYERKDNIFDDEQTKLDGFSYSHLRSINRIDNFENAVSYTKINNYHKNTIIIIEGTGFLFIDA